MSQLIIENAIVQDEWTRVIPPILGDEPVRKQAGKIVIFKVYGEDTFTERQIAATEIPETGKVLVPFSIWQAYKDKLSARMDNGEVGIVFATHEPIEALIAEFPDINKLPIIAILVGHFPDGRNFTLSRLLRERHGYNNELRAIGDILRDQLYFLKRCGFNSYEIRSDRNAQEAIDSLTDFTQPYQAAVDDALPVWRRVSRG